jgi:hypothetical protein
MTTFCLAFYASYLSTVTHSGWTEGEGEPEEPFLPEFQAAAKKCNYVKVREYKYVKGIVSLQVYLTNWLRFLK